MSWFSFPVRPLRQAGVNAYDGHIVRVLAIVNDFPVPGSINGIFNLSALRALRDRGHTVEVVRFVPWFPPIRKRWDAYRRIPAAYEADGIAVRTLRAFVGPKRYGMGTLPQQLRLPMQRIYQTFEPDVVQVHGLLPSGLLARNAPVPVVVTGHGSETYALPFLRPSLGPLARSVIAHASASVGVAKFIAGHLRNFGAQSPRVIYNGADERIFFERDRAACRKMLQIDAQRPCVLFAGNMLPEKGLDELREAMLALRDLQPQLILAGPGERAEMLRDELCAAGIDVLAPGSVSHEQLALFMGAADVVTLPSYQEGLPVVLCEAMNAHRAVVATNVGGIGEIVRDGQTGFLIPPHDAPALAVHLRYVLENPQMKRMFETEAGAFAAKHLSWTANARAYEELYESILRSRRRVAVIAGHAETRTLTGFPTGT
jgi:teichuronic acid biosynthesis glycosyltransferase TuaC